MVYCKHCGSEIKEDAKFCPTCGKPVQEETQSQTEPSSQQPLQTQTYQPENKKLGCLFWGLAIFIAPIALIWALTLNKDHPQKKSAIIVPSIFLLSFVLMMVLLMLTAIFSDPNIDTSYSSVSETPASVSETPASVSETPAPEIEVVELDKPEVVKTQKPEAKPRKTETTQLTLEEQKYINLIGTQSQTLSTALNNVSVLSQNPLFGNDEWILTMATQLAIIQGEYESLKSTTPPKSLKAVHNKYLEGLSHYNLMTKLLASGIDNNNPTLIENASKEMEKGSICIGEAAKLMEQFNSSKR